MKKFYTLQIVLLITLGIFGQVPDKMSFQAIIRNGSGELVKTANVGIQISILHGSLTGTVIYVETHSKMTNENGLISIEIGGGTPVTGTFSSIDWSTGLYFLKTETDPTGGTSYSIAGTSQILSVPYALYAKSAGNGFSGNYNDLTFKPSLAEVASTGNYYDLLNTPALFNGSWANITGKPATLSGYGITDGMNMTHVANGITSTFINNWNLAYSWGNHASAGYATLPLQTGNEGKVLSTDGNSTSWITPVTSSDLMSKVSKAGDNMTGQLTINNVTDRTALVLNSGSHTELRIKGGASYIPMIFIGTSASSPNAEDAIIQFYDINYGSSSRLAFHMAPANNVLNLLSNGNVGIGNPAPSTKLDVSGVITASGGNSANWNSAFGWGNHAAAGYSSITHIHQDATNSVSGFMSSADKLKLDGITPADGSETKVIAGANMEIAGTGTAVDPYVVAAKPHTIGETYGGGVVFYVYDNGMHGLIAASADGSINGNPNLTLLYNGALRVAGAFANGVGAGKGNTSAIIAMQAAITPANPMLATMNAAYAAVNYSAQDANGVRYGDWYLPSQFEMVLMSNSTATIPGYIRSNPYWSSTEVVDNVNYAYMVVNGSLSVQDKRNSYRVRPIRAF